MEKYKTRKIQFRELIETNGWKVKVYTISINGDFDHKTYYQNVIRELPVWFNLDNGFKSPDDKIAFLILHQGREGIFSLINWWFGENMLNTNIFLTAPDNPSEFKKISGNGAGPCIWELEIINHESKSWTNNILKQEKNPNFTKYIEDVINMEM